VTALQRANALRKPNGRLSSEAAYILFQRRAGIASAQARSHSGFKTLIDAARKSARRRMLLRLLTEALNLGIECPCMKSLRLSLEREQLERKLRRERRVA
jgi:hypothetical protein